MIRILHVHTLPVISGSGINTFLSMKGLDRNIFDVELACAPGGRLIELTNSHQIKVWTFSNLVQPLHPIKDFLAIINLTVFLKKGYYHIVHTHNSKAGFIGRLAARLAKIPVVIHTVHGFAFHEQESYWRQALFRNLERLASRWCDKEIYISQPLIDWALKERIVGSDKIVKIYSGIDLNQFRPVTQDQKSKIRKKWGIGEDDEVIGIVSKLWEGKGHAILLDAFKKIKQDIKNSRLVIVGEGHLHDILVSKVKKLGIEDSVLFTGFQMDVSEILGTFDIAVLPSFFEGMGRVILEAMAMEKPVVASRVGGIPDLVDDGVTGYLTEPGDVHELTEALKRILMDKHLAQSMGTEARKSTTSQFSSEVMVESISRVYNECLKSKGIDVVN
ncbi:glycosyltransferase family 4 protein [Thermodesulfobacteriota bacterium]